MTHWQQRSLWHARWVLVVATALALSKVLCSVKLAIASASDSYSVRIKQVAGAVSN